MKTKFLGGILAVILAFSFFACSDKEKEKLVMATSANFPPYEYIDEKGNYQGIDIEIAQKIATRLEKKLVIENMEFNRVVAAVTSGVAHMGLAGFTITNERKQNIGFSDVYSTSKQVVVVRKYSTIRAIKDIYAKEYKIGVQRATTAAIIIKKDIADDKLDAKLFEYQSFSQALNALTLGQIDCIIIDSAPAEHFVAQNSNLKILETGYNEESYAIIVQKTNTELLFKINQILDDMKRSGELQEIINRHIN